MGLQIKNKDNSNVFESFGQFMKHSNLSQYKPTRTKSDHESTFMRSQFTDILDK